MSLFSETRGFGDQALPELTELPAAIRRDLEAASRVMVYRPGEIVIRAGERGDPGVVQQGLLSYSIRSDDGRRATLVYLNEGDWFGAQSLYARMSHSIIAVTDSRVLHYDRVVVQQNIQRHAAVANWITQGFVDLVAKLDEAAATTAFMTVAQRVVHHLVAMASVDERGTGPMVARISQQQIADAVGSVRDVVARVIRDLKARDIVETSRSGIVIKNELELYRFAVASSRIHYFPEKDSGAPQFVQTAATSSSPSRS